MKNLVRSVKISLTALLTVPPGVGLWSRAWRTLAVCSLVLLLVVGLWGFFAALWVGIPHAIVAGTLGSQICVSSATNDCFRAIADARQAVLFSLGGLIALVGIVFTYLRWRNEAKTTRVAVEGGELAHQADARERRHAQTTQVIDALPLLKSEDLTTQIAAISLLGDYATTTDDPKQAGLILDVLVEFIRDRSTNNNRLVEGQVSDETLPVGRVTARAIATTCNAAAALRQRIDLSELIFVDLRASNVDWSYADLRETTFSGGNLARARFRRAGSVNQLIRLRFLGTRLDGADFSETELFGVEFSARPSDGHVAKTIDDIRFTGAELNRCTFEDRILHGPSFAGSTLFNVDFAGATLNGPRWAGACFDACELHKAKMPRRTDFNRVSLSRTTLTPAQVAMCIGLGGWTREGDFVTREIDLSARTENVTESAN